MTQVTELLPVPRPVVFGLLRTLRYRARVVALTAMVRDYCERHELALHAVVTESPQGDDGFTDLLASMSSADAYGVIVPSPSHLGVASVAALRKDAIARARLQLIVIRVSAGIPNAGQLMVNFVDGRGSEVHGRPGTGPQGSARRRGRGGHAAT